jgi:hypothetical protein
VTDRLLGILSGDENRLNKTRGFFSLQNNLTLDKKTAVDNVGICSGMVGQYYVEGLRYDHKMVFKVTCGPAFFCSLANNKTASPQ